MSNIWTSNDCGKVERAYALLISQYLLRCCLIAFFSGVELREEGGVRHLAVNLDVEFGHQLQYVRVLAELSHAPVNRCALLASNILGLECPGY
jgi:hypothetical protein